MTATDAPITLSEALRRFDLLMTGRIRRSACETLGFASSSTNLLWEAK